ncbi:MAG: hypothetical protein WAU28_01410 [Candidatus Moraniibacteriota bacterium]
MLPFVVSYHCFTPYRMKIIITEPTDNAVTMFRRAGYTFQRKDGPARNASRSDAGGDEMSFIRPLARAGYPRFHAYAKMHERDLLINFHLDQKRETYGDETRHHGEYGNDGPLKEEASYLLRHFGPKAKLG